MITPQQLRNPQVKPKWQLPVGVMESVVAYNCRKYGMPRPVLAMPMWEGAGNRALDYSGRGNHGAINGADWDADGLDFNGTSDYVDLGTSFGQEVDDYTSLTISGFAKINTLTVDQEIVARSFDAADALELRYDAGEKYWYFVAVDTDVRVAKYSQTQVVTDKIYHVVGVWDGALLTIYVDTKLGNVSAACNDLKTSTQSLNIGRAVNPGRHLNGIINNVSMFNTALTAAQVKFLHDNPYFMYEIPEELYGYAAAVGDTATNLLHGKIIIKDSSIVLVDGLLKVQETVADLFDGELKVIEKVTSLADGKLQVQDIDTDLADGKLQVKDSTTSLADGKVQVQDSATDLADGKVQIQDSVTDLVDGKVIVTTVGADTGQADGKIQIKDVTTGIVDGLVKVKDSVTGLADGKVKISNIASNLADGIIRIKDTATGIADGKVRIKDVATGTADGLLKIIEKATSNIDGKLKIKDTITDLSDGKISITGAVTAVIRRITIANKKPSYRLVAEQPKPAYRLKTENK